MGCDPLMQRRFENQNGKRVAGSGPPFPTLALLARFPCSLCGAVGGLWRAVGVWH